MGRARIHLTGAELTTADGRTTGHVTTSLTEGGRTTTERREIDSGPVPAVRLTEAQRKALAEIARGRPVAGNDEGWVQPAGGRPTIAVLHRLKLIEREGYDAQGIMCGRGLCRITSAGRAALAAAEGGRDG